MAPAISVAIHVKFFKYHFDILDEFPLLLFLLL